MGEQVEPNRPTSLTKLKDWATIGASIAVVLVALVGGMQWVVSSTIAPIVERLVQIDNRVQQLEKVVQDEFRAVHDDTSVLRERLTRVETLLEQLSQDRGRRTLSGGRHQ
jgi:type VI protein secretion system component VasK